jgi:hypothetical protein
MKRLLCAAVLLGLAAPARADDQVFYWDEAAKVEKDVRGSIKDENAAGIRILAKTPKGPQEMTIATADIRAVIYQSARASAPDFRSARGKELQAMMPTTKKDKRMELLHKALDSYRDLDVMVKDEPNARRFAQYKIAEVFFLVARDDPSQADAAITVLTAYKNGFAGGWEMVPALKMLGQLLEEKGDVQGASQAYADLSALPNVPKKTKQEAEMLAVRVLLRGGKFADVEQRLKDLQQGLSADDPQRTYVAVLLVQAQLAQGNLGQAETQLKAALQATADSAVKAVARNLLGDYYRAKGQLEQAFWQYLWVDVLYNQDREETAKALYHLSKLFDKVKKDVGRAEECLRRLKGQEFAGTAYQRRANEEKK